MWHSETRPANPHGEGEACFSDPLLLPSCPDSTEQGRGRGRATPTLRRSQSKRGKAVGRSRSVGGHAYSPPQPIEAREGGAEPICGDTPTPCCNQLKPEQAVGRSRGAGGMPTPHRSQSKRGQAVGAEPGGRPAATLRASRGVGGVIETCEPQCCFPAPLPCAAGDVSLGAGSGSGSIRVGLTAQAGMPWWKRRGGPHARADEDASRSLEFQGRAGSSGAQRDLGGRFGRLPACWAQRGREHIAAAGRWGPGRLAAQPAMHLMQTPLGLAHGPDPLVWTALGGPIPQAFGPQGGGASGHPQEARPLRPGIRPGKEGFWGAQIIT